MTPLLSTKLPLRVWLEAKWLLLQSDQGFSSVRLAEPLGMSQPTALQPCSPPKLVSITGTREHYRLEHLITIPEMHLYLAFAAHLPLLLPAMAAERGVRGMAPGTCRFCPEPVSFFFADSVSFSTASLR